MATAFTLELENSRTDEFLYEVSQYMRYWNSYANVMDNFGLDKICAEPYAEVKKLLKLFYRAFDPMHNSWFNGVFTRENFQPNIVDQLIKGHCFTLKTRSRSVFIGFLYICSFTYSLLLYCEKNRMNGMLEQIQKFVTESFNTLKPRFIAEGGLPGLRHFCLAENLPTVLQFISDCYCEEAVLNTYVCYETHCLNIGLHGRETLNLLMNNVGVFECAVNFAFDRELNASSNYNLLVGRSFTRLRSDLQNGPFQNILKHDKANLAKDPTYPLSRI